MIIVLFTSQANGLVERFNQTLQRMLAKFVHKKKTQWSSYVDTCVFAYNTSKHNTSKFTPFELMFGRTATLPVDLNIEQAHPKEETDQFCHMPEPDMSRLRKERAQRLEEAKANIVAAQTRQKEQYDHKHSMPELFQEGQLVLKKDFRWKKSKGGKLGARFLGPYTIQKVLQRGVYELMSEEGKYTVRATGAHLKPYNRPDTTLHQSEESQSVSHSYLVCPVSYVSDSFLLLHSTTSQHWKTPFHLFLLPLHSTRVKNL